MDIKTVRRARLRLLIQEYGTQAALSERTGKPAAYFSQLITQSHRGVGDKFARDLEMATGKPRGWMDTPIPQDETGSAFPSGARSPHARYIWHINSIQAGRAREVIDNYEPGDGMAAVGVDQEMADMLGPYAFALDIEGESMVPEYYPGDLVIIDPDASVRPGDVVAARIGNEQAATIKRYRDRGTDASGNPVFELVPHNDDYPTVIVSSENPGEIVGPVVEHRRRLRRAPKR